MHLSDSLVRHSAQEADLERVRLVFETPGPSIAGLQLTVCHKRTHPSTSAAGGGGVPQEG